MVENIDHKLESKDKLINFYNENKLKLLSLIGLLVIIITTSIFIKVNKDKQNILASEKYIKAGLYLSSKKIAQSKELYEEIIFSNNKFYSILALNSILEENLEDDKKKILEYFKEIEGMNISKEQKDIVTFKKALFLIKTSSVKEGKSLLKKLIEKNSKIKSLAEEVISR